MTDTEHPMVAVSWHDSGLSFAMSWDDEVSLIERAKRWDGTCTTVGLLLYEDERCLALALTRDDSKDQDRAQMWAQIMLVSRKNLISIHTLDLGTPRPLAFVPATSSEEPSATPERSTPPDVPPSVPDYRKWCFTHGSYESTLTFNENHDGRYDQPYDPYP